jgi:hypothetical protein
MIFEQRLKNVADGSEIWDLALFLGFGVIVEGDFGRGKTLGDLVLATHNNPGGAGSRNLGHCVKPSKASHLER